MTLQVADASDHIICTKTYAVGRFFFMFSVASKRFLSSVAAKNH